MEEFHKLDMKNKVSYELSLEERLYNRFHTSSNSVGILDRLGEAKGSYSRVLTQNFHVKETPWLDMCKNADVLCRDLLNKFKCMNGNNFLM